MSKRAAVRVKEKQDKREGNCVIESSTKSDTEMEYFSENDNSNLESEYFATISPSVITRQPYPQMNFFKNAKISNLINDQTTTTTTTIDDSRNEEKRRNITSKLAIDHLAKSDNKISRGLQSVMQFYIREHSNVIDTFLNFLRKDRYVVQDIRGNLMYHVFETSDNMYQCDCKTAKHSQLHFITSTGQEVIRMEKLLTCSSFFGTRCGTYPVCCIFSTSNSHQIIIESPPGYVIGAVIQQISLIRSYYQVEDARGNPKYFIIGSINNFSCFARRCYDIQYEVISADKNILIGIIIKQWAERNDKITTIDNFNISFPRNITAKDKMLLLGALFLIAKFKCKFHTSMILH